MAELGYDRTFSRKALTNNLNARPCADAPARLFDDALPAKALAALRRALRPAARYWRETDYGSPAVGFFSFTHRIDALSDTALEGVLKAIWRAAVKALPEARNATYVEWWAHTRRRGDGHALHYDSVPGLVDEAPPRHPLASTVTFLEASVGGPTIIFDQTVANKRSTRAWVAPARPNRLLVFDGRCCTRLARRARARRRTTFMANFGGTTARATRPTRGDAGHQHPFPPPDCDWPADFASRWGRGDSLPRSERAGRGAGRRRDASDGGAVSPGDLLTDGTFLTSGDGCEARAGGGDEDVGPRRRGRNTEVRDRGRSRGPGVLLRDDSADEDAKRRRSGTAAGRAITTSTGHRLPRRHDRCFGDDFGPTADVDYRRSSER